MNYSKEDENDVSDNRETDVDEEFNQVINGIRTKSYKVAVNQDDSVNRDEVVKPDDVVNQNDTVNRDHSVNQGDNVNRDLEIKLKTKIIDEDIEDNALQTNNIIKTIDYDDEILTMSYKEILVFNEIERYVRKFDNCCRIIIPMVFVVFISIIYSYN